MGENFWSKDIYVKDGTLFFNNKNTKWIKWRDRSLLLPLKKKFIKIKDKEKPVKTITLTSKLTCLDFLKYMGGLTYKTYSKNGTLLFSVSSAVDYIRKKIEEDMKNRWSSKKSMNKKN